MEETQTLQRISKDMTIGDFVKEFPSLVNVLLNEGVHCVGCGASYWETIEQGLMGHGKTEEEIDEIISKLNSSIPREIGNKDIVITDTAARKLKEIIIKENKEGYGLRVEVISGGCSGYKYSFELDNKEKANDEVFDIEGVKFFVDKASLLMIKGSRIDYLESLQGAGFKVSNPNSTHSCGCGESFS